MSRQRVFVADPKPRSQRIIEGLGLSICGIAFMFTSLIGLYSTLRLPQILTLAPLEILMGISGTVVLWATAIWSLAIIRHELRYPRPSWAIREVVVDDMAHSYTMASVATNEEESHG